MGQMQGLSRRGADGASRVGTHVAVGAGLVKGGLVEAAESGAEVIQFFAGNPRSWAPMKPEDDARELAFRNGCGELDVEVVVHAPHLINLGSPDSLVAEKSSVLLAAVMRRAARLGAKAVVFHAGSSVTAPYRAEALRQVRDATGRLLDHGPPGIDLLVEPTAGGGAALASTIESTVEYLDAVDERVGLCLDTCHLHAAGHDLSTPAGMRGAISQLSRSIRVGRLRLIHVNDSRDTPGSRRDRHESLGHGTIGAEALSALVQMSELEQVPLLVETPTHPEDVALLKQWRTRAAKAGQVA